MGLWRVLTCGRWGKCKSLDGKFFRSCLWTSKPISTSPNNRQTDRLTIRASTANSYGQTKFVTSSQAHKLTSSQAYKLTSWQAHKLTSSQVDKLTSWQAHRLTSSQAYKLTSSQAHKLTSSQVDKLTSSQAYKHNLIIGLRRMTGMAEALRSNELLRLT